MDFIWIALIIISVFLFARERTKRLEDLKNQVTLLQIMIESLNIKINDIKDSISKKENNE